MKKFILYDDNLNEISKFYFDEFFDFNFNKVQEIPELDYEYILEHLDYGISIFLPYEEGNDFVIQNMGNDIIQLAGLNNVDEFRGCLLSEAFPYAKESKLIDSLKEVYKTSIPKTFHGRAYDNGNLFYACEYKIVKPRDKVCLFSKVTSDLVISEEKKDYLLNQSNYGVTKLTKDFKMVYANTAFQKITGYSIEELKVIGLDNIISDFYNPSTKSKSWKEVVTLLFNDNIIDSHSTMKILSKSGEFIYFSTHASKFNPINEFLQIFFVDITPQIKTENRLKHITANLRLAQKNNKFSFAYFTEGKWMWDEGIYEILEINPEDYDITKDLIREFADSESIGDYFYKFANLETVSRFGIDTTIITPKGNEKILHVDFNVELDENGEIVYVSKLITDVSNQVFTKNQLVELKDNLDIVQEVSKSGLFFRNGDKYTWTEGIYNILERKPRKGDEFKKIIAERVIFGNETHESLLKDIINDNYDNIPNIFKDFESIQLENGKIKHVVFFIKKDSNEGNNKNNDFSGLIQDITDEITYKNELNLKSLEALKLKENMDVVQGFAKVALGDWDAVNGIYEWTEEFYNILEVDSSVPLLDFELLDFIVEEDKDKFINRKKLISPENPVWLENLSIITNSGIKHLSVHVIYSFKDDSSLENSYDLANVENVNSTQEDLKTQDDVKNNIESAVIFVQDITDLINYENKLKEAIEDKNVLLKEVHHRVKNNLQIITSLIRLDSRFKKDDPEGVISEIQNRINAMALIHEKIYQSESLAHVDIGKYIESIVDSLFSLYGVGIKFKRELEEIQLNMDKAIPLGLIINELVNNTIKYAFPDENWGTLFISLKKDGSKVILRFYDDGVGLPDDFDIFNSNSLGLTVVNNLSNQINADLFELDFEGAGFEIVFEIE